MGREVKRVPLDFDWPMNMVWPGYMGGICTEQVEYATQKKGDEACELCRKAARLAGLPLLTTTCPDWDIHPLKGEGWQMWEDTTEGSPMSPVFKTPEELALWLVESGASALGSETATYEQWLGMIKKGWAPSMMMSVSGEERSVESGVAFVARQDKET